MGRRYGLVYVRNQSGQLVRVGSETKITSKPNIDPEDIAILKQRKIEKIEQEDKKQEKPSRPRVKKQTIHGEKPIEAVMVLEELDRTILESGVMTPQEAHEKLGILLKQAEVRIQSIVIKLEVTTFEEAIRKYRNRLPMKI